MADTTTRQIGHPTMTLADLAPKKSAAFSPNLHKYLKERGHFFKDGGLLDGVYEVLPDTKAAEQFGAGTLLLGYPDVGFFTGARLMAVLCNGREAARYAYPCGSGLKFLEGFWDSYLKVGRCAIDPDHQMHFMADRFSVHSDGDGRDCLWCGHQQRKVVTPRVVHDTTWVSV